MTSRTNQDNHAHGSLARALRGSSLVRFGAFTLALLGALFWARQKLISPTPRMAVADPQHVAQPPAPQGAPTADASDH